jgi:hypothetical protein
MATSNLNEGTESAVITPRSQSSTTSKKRKVNVTTVSTKISSTRTKRARCLFPEAVPVATPPRQSTSIQHSAGAATPTSTPSKSPGVATPTWTPSKSPGFGLWKTDDDEGVDSGEHEWKLLGKDGETGLTIPFGSSRFRACEWLAVQCLKYHEEHGKQFQHKKFVNGLPAGKAFGTYSDNMLSHCVDHVEVDSSDVDTQAALRVLLWL